MTDVPELEAEGLLAFYVNGTLSPLERKHVEEALSLDAGLRAELAELQRTYADMQAEPLPHHSDTGFARLMREIEQTPQDTVPAADMPDGPAARPPILKLALVAALVALAVQSALLWFPEQTGVELASGAGQGDIVVAFQPDATEGDIRALLTALDLQIVSGPSSLGLYQLGSANADASIEALIARPDVVESAEHAMH
jgi:anti-sigma factor RsiW